MPHYISLLQWTQAGAEKIKDSPARLDAAKKDLAAAGVQIREFYMTLGKYDMVCIIDAKDDAALAKGLLTLSSKGTVRTKTMRAFPESEYRSIVGSLG
jgi:uncharacterized protein with GYD domain